MDLDYFPAHVLLADLDESPDDAELLLHTRSLVLHKKCDKSFFHSTNDLRNTVHCRFLGRRASIRNYHRSIHRFNVIAIHNQSFMDFRHIRDITILTTAFGLYAIASLEPLQPHLLCSPHRYCLCA